MTYVCVAFGYCIPGERGRTCYNDSTVYKTFVTMLRRRESRCTAHTHGTPERPRGAMRTAHTRVHAGHAAATSTDHAHGTDARKTAPADDAVAVCAAPLAIIRKADTEATVSLLSQTIYCVDVLADSEAIHARPRQERRAGQSRRLAGSEPGRTASSRNLAPSSADTTGRTRTIDGCRPPTARPHPIVDQAHRHVRCVAASIPAR